MTKEQLELELERVRKVAAQAINDIHEQCTTQINKVTNALEQLMIEHRAILQIVQDCGDAQTLAAISTYYRKQGSGAQNDTARQIH